jgi:MoaA/NifB/PqqE/SkfB family radical SAM enzyme
MGFPRPWPTEWPEIDPRSEPDAPVRWTEEPDEREEPGKPDDPGEPNHEPPHEVPEYRRDFYSVTWAVNHACNLRCTHCYDVVPYQRTDLDSDGARAVIDRLDAAGVRFIAFSGGELFLRKDLFELMAECRRRKMQFGARSNGTLITPAVAGRLAQLGIAVVGVSFDGATADTHDAVRGAGAFRAALAGLNALSIAGIRTQMEVVLSRQNANEAAKFIALAEIAGASEVNFSAMVPEGRGFQRMYDLLDHDLWLNLTNMLRQASVTARLPVSPNCALAGRCVANIEPHVTCDGWMTPCYLSTEKLFHVLEVPPKSFRERLLQSRKNYLDICGRRRWTRGSKAQQYKYMLPIVNEIR